MASPAKVWTLATLKAELDKLRYNTIDTALCASEFMKDPNRQYKTMKELSHKALVTGQGQMDKDENAKANSSFAFAYQTRCVADWAWVHILHKAGDSGHAHYVEVQRAYSKYATGKLTGEQKEEVRKLIAKIHD